MDTRILGFGGPRCQNCGMRPKRSGSDYCCRVCVDEAEAKRRSAMEARFKLPPPLPSMFWSDPPPLRKSDELCVACGFRPRIKQILDRDGKLVVVDSHCNLCQWPGKTSIPRSPSSPMLRKPPALAALIPQSPPPSPSAGGTKSKISQGNSYSKTYPCCKATIITVLSRPPAFCPLCMLENIQKYVGQTAGLAGDTPAAWVPPQSPTVSEKNIPAAAGAVASPPASGPVKKGAADSGHSDDLDEGTLLPASSEDRGGAQKPSPRKARAPRPGSLSPLNKSFGSDFHI